MHNDGTAPHAEARSVADYTPPADVPATDLASLLGILADIVTGVKQASTQVAGCTTRLNLSKLDVALREAAAIIEGEASDLRSAAQAITQDIQLPVSFPPSDRWSGTRQWCAPGAFSELLSPRQINFLIAKGAEPGAATITYREALQFTDAIPPVALRHAETAENARALREAYSHECPRCGARPGADCVTTTGRPATVHAGRMKA